MSDYDPYDEEGRRYEGRNDRRHEQGRPGNRQPDALDDIIQQNQNEGQRRAEEQDKVRLEFDMKPREVKEDLDKYVIGQDRAKKYLSNAVCYHYARVKRYEENPEEEGDSCVKKNVLLVGNTGVGKTYMVKKLSKLIGVPFVKADATKFSATGYVGRDVEEIIMDLYMAADKNIKLAEYGIVYIDEIDKIKSGATFGKDVSGIEVQRNLLKLMEDTEVDVKQQNQMQDLMALAGGGQQAQRKFNTRNTLFIMSGAFPGLQDLVRKRCGEDEWKKHIRPVDFVNYGFEAEFVARLPVRVALDDLSSDDLYKILTQSEDSIVKEYIKDFNSFGINLNFTDDALRRMAELASEEGTGGRALTSVFESTLVDFMHELPSLDIKEFEVTGEIVERPQGAMMGLIFDKSVEQYQKEFSDKHRIDLRFDKEAVGLLKDIALCTGKDPRDICKELIGENYVHVLKLNNKREFNVTADVVKDPKGYLDSLIDGYRGR
ncbi:MAG: AAA family ATPase [Candidatus Woesearchaeota archaeon]